MAEEIIKEDILPVETVTYGDPDPKPKSYAKKIHENLVLKFGKDQVPDEISFEKEIKNPKYAKLIHENLVNAFGETEVPDFKSFSDSLIVVSPEKKNLGEANLLKSGNTLVPTELQLSSTENNLQSIVNQRPDPFDKNASPSDLARQSFNLKQPKSVTKKAVGVDMMGMPVESNEDIYDENSINTAKEIDKHLEKLGYTKDFASTIIRIPEKYKEAVGYTDQELADLYKSDKNEFNKRTSNVIWRENLRDSMMEMADNIDKSDLSPEEKDIQINKINTQAELLNQGAEQYAGDLKNKQYYVGESAKNIKQFITNPEKQKQALEDLALSTADDFGSIEDLEDKSKTALSKNINDYQSVALNYLDQIDPEKAAFYRKYIDIDTKDLQKFQYKGYDQLQKELDEIGLNLVVNNAKNKLKTLSDIAKQQGGQLDPQDYEEYNKLLETANTADARLSKLGLVYPNTVNVDTRSIAQELMGGGSSTLGLAGKNLAYGLGKTGKGFIDVVLSPFRSQQINDNAALEALGIENYVESKTIPTKNQSALSRDLPKITPELDARILAIKNDKKLSQTEKEEQVDQLLQSNRDKWTPASTETSWNLGPNAIFSSVANLAAKLAPFFAIEVLSQGAATPEILPATLASFGRMFSNVLVTSYSEELARAMNEKSANPELDAYGSVLVNSLAYKAAGVGDIVKNIRGAANELGGITAKIIGKLEDKAIVNALKNPNSTLKGFLNNAGQVIKEKGLEGVKTAAIFEGVLGAKDVMGGAKVDEEFIKQKALNLLTFSLFNTALGSTIGLSKVGKENKEALFLAATNKDEVLYEAKKALENKQISQSAYNEITQNVEAASKVLEKVPMVDGKGNQLGRKEATELMYLKIKEQYLEDQIKKDTPIKVQEKITKDLAEVQDQIDKVYKGTFIEGIGKPFEGIEARGKKELIVKNEQEVKPTEDKKFSITEENIKGGVESLPYKGLNDADVSDIVDKIDNNEKLDFKIDSQEFDDKINYTLYSDNRPFGTLLVDKNTGEVSDAGVHKALINKGVGSEMYSKVNDIIYKETGKTLKSDSKQISPSAIKLWEKLVKSNKATQVGIAENGKPLFVMNKPTEVKVKEEVKPTEVESEKSDVEKTLYPTISGSKPLSEALPNGVYKKLSNDLFAYSDKGDRIAAIVDKANGNIVSKSFWNAKDGEWKLPNKENLKDDAKRFGINEDIYIKKYQDAVDILNNAEKEVKPTEIIKNKELQENKLILQNGKDKGQNKGTGTPEKNTEQVRYNGTDVIGQRSRPESEKAASRKKAKEKISLPETNASLKAANDYNKSAGLPEIQTHEFKPSDKDAQTKIGETYQQLQDVTSPTYKETELERQIFDSYKSKYPELFEKYDIKSYKDLVEKSYAELAKEVDAQFEALPIKVEFHEGDHNYESSEEMLDDVHNFGHLWVFKGGDDHTLLGSKTADKNGITANDKFRAVHDYFGHSIEGYQFGKDGEENAWIEHSKMFSPLAQAALSSETRGQNSFVNYSGINDVALEKMKTASALTKKGLSENNTEMIAAGKALLNEANNDFQFAEQKSIVLPEKYTDTKKYSEKTKPKGTVPKIEEPVVEEIKPTKTPKEVQISKKALGNNYNFSKEFDIRGGDVVATDVLTEVTNRAEKNGVDVTTQRAIEVGLMSKGTPEPTEYNIITAGSHLLNIDAKIAKAQETGNLAEVESLNEQRTEVLSVLRTLGNKAGRNLGLFNLVFQETDRSEIKLTRDYLKKVLKVEVPETIAELEKSNLTAEQKKIVRPYVEKIEKAKASFDVIEKEVNKNITKINDDEVNAAIEKARAEGKKEGFKEGMKSNTSEEKQKKSKQIKDLASQIRRSDELDKFLKGAGPLGNAEKASFVDLGTYKEIVANVLDAVASAIELGEDVSQAIKKAVNKFKDVDAARLISDVQTIMSKAQLPNKQEVMEKILKISKAESANDITKTISDKGLIKDIVNSYLGENLTNDQVLDAATKDLKKILPNVTREQVSDAYAERGQFKKETKAKIENEINKRKADVKRLAVKEAKLKALEAADDYHLEETKEGKKRVTSEYEKELDEKIKNLLNEKSNVEKQQKVSKTPKTEQDKIDEINREIKFVKETKSVYDQAIKDPKKASDALIAAREERDKTYAALGLKLEKNAKAPILIERNYQEALKEIENSYFSDQEKNNKIAELKAQRDLDLQGTKQGVVSSLSDDVNNYIESNIENSDLNDSLKDVLKDLNPSGEKLDDQINKAYNKLNKLVKDENLTKEEKQNIKEIITDLENNNQLTSDELASKRLKKQWENEIRTAETDIASGNFTKLPSNTYDYRRNDELFRLNKARENKSGQLNRMIADAKEKNRTTAEKAIDLSTKFLVSGIHTTAKVAEAATFKPFMDSMVDLTAGRLTSYITGAPYTSLYSVKKGYKTFTAFKNKEAAEKYIQSLQDKRDVALENLKEAHENGVDIKKADKEFKKADLEYAVSTLYNSIETNVLNSFWQYMKHGATDYDVSIGKSSKKDISEYRTVLGKTGYVLDGWIRMHGAMKSSLSARPEMMKVFSSTLKDFQRKGMELNAENISTAMVLAADAYEAGRLTNKTALSKIISRGKGSEKSTAMRLITKGIVPVSTIAVNLAKRGIDYSTLGTEGFVRLANETKKGMKLNEIEGKTYDSLVSAIKDGWSRIPLKERVYINGVVGRGLFGSAIMLATAYGLQNGMIKYGGTFEDQRKRKIMGSDDEQLKAGEWEFFGKRLPKAASLFLNHLPEFLAVSLIADNYQINKMGGTSGEKFETTIDEVEARLPFQTIAGVFVPGRRVNTLVDRFTRIPIAAEAATLFDEKAEFRDKSDFINRIRGNVGFGIVNPTKAQQKQINEIMKQIRKLPSETLTAEDEKDIDAIIEDIKNTDFGELEIKKAMEESKKE